MRDRIGGAAALAARHPRNSAPDMDEALRRATAARPPAARVLADVADRLTRVNPDRLMDEGALRLLVHRAAGRPKAADAAREAAPPIGPGMTRRRYAQLLREVRADA